MSCRSRLRIAAVAAVVAVASACSPAAEPADGTPSPSAAPTEAAPAPDETETPAPTETATEAPTPAPTEPPPADEPSTDPAVDEPEEPAEDVKLRAGDTGVEVVALQARLSELGLDPGPADGTFGSATTSAVYVVQKLHGLTVDGIVGEQTRAALAADLPEVAPLVADGAPTRVEIDRDRQLLFVYVDGELALISHTSTGAPGWTTRAGDFTITRRISGWRHARLGKLYNPLYFNSGIAIHGSTFVPTWPDSHGCARVPMHIAEYLPGMVPNGTPVHVVAG